MLDRASFGASSSMKGIVRKGKEPMRDEVRRRYAAVAVSVREGGDLRVAGPMRDGCSTRRRRGWIGQGGAIRRLRSASCRRLL